MAVASLPDPKICSLVFIANQATDEFLLGEKMDKIGVGRFTGPGGKLDPEDHNSLETCAVRETYVETGIRLKAELLDKRAILTFYNYDQSGNIISIFEVHIFVTFYWEGEPRDSAEMTKVGWYTTDPDKLFDLLPFMASDSVWLPMLLEGQKIRGNIRLSADQSQLIREPQLEVVTGF